MKWSGLILRKGKHHNSESDAKRTLKVELGELGVTYSGDVSGVNDNTTLSDNCEHLRGIRE